MSLKNQLRLLPAGAAITAVLALLAGTLIAQVVPAAGSREKSTTPPTFLVPSNTSTGAKAPVPPPATTDRKLEDSDNEINVLIAQALDQPTDLDLKETDIRDAVAKLAARTGIPIDIEPGTLSLLPYGAKTTLSLTIKGKPLRESLTALLRPIGLMFVVENRRVVIRATPPLRRVVERTTWSELELLEKLSTTPWSESLPGNKIQFQFQQVSGGLPSLLNAANNVGKGSASDVLEQATAALGWSWYPAGNTIVVLPKERQIERQLEKRLSTVDRLPQVLQDLSSKTGVPVRLDPGVFAMLPAGTDRFTLSFQNTSARQILELISAQTGLAFAIEPEGVRVSAGTLLTTTRPAADKPDQDVTTLMSQLRSNPIVGQITLPASKDGKVVTTFIRYDDLPPDLKEALPKIKSAAIQMMRESLQTTTKPTP